MIDKDLKEKAAITEVFPNCQPLLCWFHVLQAVYRWLNSAKSGVSGKDGIATRKEIVSFLRKMRYATKVKLDY